MKVYESNIRECEFSKNIEKNNLTRYLECGGLLYYNLYNYPIYEVINITNNSVNYISDNHIQKCINLDEFVEHINRVFEKSKYRGKWIIEYSITDNRLKKLNALFRDSCND